MHLKISCVKWRPFCPGGDELTHWGRDEMKNIFKCIFFNENVWISIKISLKCVPKGPINNIPALVQIMAWRRPGDKPLSRPMMARLPTHICVTRPQWVNSLCHDFAVGQTEIFIIFRLTHTATWPLSWLIQPWNSSFWKLQDFSIHTKNHSFWVVSLTNLV